MSDVHPITLLSDDAFGWYLSGLTDGEGSFQLGELKQTKRHGHVYHQWHARFEIKLRADEQPHLTAVCARFGHGLMRRYNKRSTKQGFESKPQVAWSVHSIVPLADAVVPHFDKFPLQLKKSRDFAIWKRGVLLLKEVNDRVGYRKFTHADRETLRAIADELKAIRAYGSDPSSIVLPVRKPKETFPLFGE